MIRKQVKGVYGAAGGRAIGVYQICARRDLQIKKNASDFRSNNTSIRENRRLTLGKRAHRFSLHRQGRIEWQDGRGKSPQRLEHGAGERGDFNSGDGEGGEKKNKKNCQNKKLPRIPACNVEACSRGRLFASGMSQKRRQDLDQVWGR